MVKSRDIGEINLVSESLCGLLVRFRRIGEWRGHNYWFRKRVS